MSVLMVMKYTNKNVKSILTIYNAGGRGGSGRINYSEIYTLIYLPKLND